MLSYLHESEKFVCFSTRSARSPILVDLNKSLYNALLNSNRSGQSITLPHESKLKKSLKSTRGLNWPR